LFIGANTATGPGYYKIGGEYYTNIIDQATSSNTANTLVIRDSNGDFAAGNVTAAYFIGDGSALTNIPSSLTFTGDTGGPNTLSLLTDTLTFNGSSGITTTIDGNSVIFDVDDTVDIHANTLGIVNDLVSYTQYSLESFAIDGEITNEPFADRFNNGLAGWVSTFTLTTHNDRPRCLYNLYPSGSY
jgi:hypothetical protein